MSEYPFSLEPVGARDRSGFRCGVEALDRYFQTQVTQDIRRRLAACFVAIEITTGEIAGYYTLSASGVPLTDIPADIGKKLPRYPSVPAARIGRLAVDHRYQSQKLGAALLINAIANAAHSPVAVFAVVVDAKDEKAATFYRHHGFQSFGSNELQLIAPVERFKDKLT